MTELDRMAREFIVLADKLCDKLLDALAQVHKEREASAVERRELLHAIATLGVTLQVEKLRQKFVAGDFSLLKSPNKLIEHIEEAEHGR